MIEYRIECTLQEIERLRCRFGRNLSAKGEKTKSSIIYAIFQSIIVIWKSFFLTWNC